MDRESGLDGMIDHLQMNAAFSFVDARMKIWMAYLERMNGFPNKFRDATIVARIHSNVASL